MILIAILVAAGLVIIVGVGAAAWRNATTNASSEAPSPAGALLVQPEDTPTVMPTMLPPDTNATAAVSSTIAIASIVTATQETSNLPLPTVTPTPEIVPVAPRAAEIAGATTLRLSLSGADFESTGRPLSFAIEPRPYTFGDGRLTAADEWCIQLGLVNQGFDLTFQLDPETEALDVFGQIVLREGFCAEPGTAMDSVDVDLSVPSDAAAQISYNLRGRRSLFGVPGLLDSDIGAIVELRITNSRPR